MTNARQRDVCRVGAAPPSGTRGQIRCNLCPMEIVGRRAGFVARKVGQFLFPQSAERRNPVHLLRVITILGALAATVLPVAAVDISGAGATFPYPLYSKWADAYKK